MAKLELMHIVDWEQAQEADVSLAACHKWLRLRKGMPPSRQDTLLKECLGAEAEMEQSKMFFHIHNSLVLNKGLMYINMTPKAETKGVLAFVIPVAGYTGMPAIRASNRPWLSLKRDFGGP